LWIIKQWLSYLTAQLDSMEVDLFTHSGSMADPIGKDLAAAPSKPLSINI